ncbi:hypothetical protein FM113_09510 [Leucobacter sp. 7(1)]|nr:hypothetical protein FM113_09510 [Leucobacter sp. 7(1)]
MVERSERIRTWIGDTAAYVFCAEKRDYCASMSGRIERDLFEHIQTPTTKAITASFSELYKLKDEKIDATLIALVPFREPDFESIRKAIEDDTFDKVVILIMREGEMSRSIARAYGALNLGTGVCDELPDSLMVEAARMMVNEEHNGLSSGIGKDATLSLIHAFRQSGVPAQKEPWLAAYFAAGGEVRHAETVAKFIDEINKGTRHRYKQRYRANIVEIIKERMLEKPSLKETS